MYPSGFQHAQDRQPDLVTLRVSSLQQFVRASSGVHKRIPAVMIEDDLCRSEDGEVVGHQSRTESCSVTHPRAWHSVHRSREASCSTGKFAPTRSANSYANSKRRWLQRRHTATSASFALAKSRRVRPAVGGFA